MACARLPEVFRPLLLSEMERAITEANLGRENTAIAKLYLIDRLPQIEIAIELCIDRDTVSKRLPEITKKVENAIFRMKSE